jgi:hypothetical protein
MSTTAHALRMAFLAFHREGRFTEEDYGALRTLLLRRTGDSTALVDGFIGLFFERHVMDERRCFELVALDDEAFTRALRHRFRQVVADERDGRAAYKALAEHVRALHHTLRPPSTGEELAFPVSLRRGEHYARTEVELALRALWREEGAKPDLSHATQELLRRYAAGEPLDTLLSFEVPEVLRRRLDGQRLAAAILRLLSEDERDLLRHVLVDDGRVDDWAQARGLSRASGYRALARLKTVCRGELVERGTRSQVEVMRALEGSLET